MKRLIFLIGLLLPSLTSGAQHLTLQPIGIGDNLPPVKLATTVNFSSENISLENYRGKLLILDFWTTNCSSCIAGLSKLDSLQRLFSGEIQIISVTPEKIAAVKKFFLNSKIHRPQIPTVTDDSLLKSYFPHASIPHVVWIDRTGKVFSFTYAEYVTEQNIRLALAGNTHHLPIKTDNIQNDYSQPFLKPIIPQSTDAPLFYSVLTGYSPGLVIKSGIELDSSSQVMRRYATNWSVVELYLMAFKKLINFPRNQILLNVARPETYLYMPNQGYFYDWQQKYAHCYEIRCPPITTRQQLQSYMVEDLNRFLHVNAEIKQMSVKCLVLKKDTSFHIPHTSGGPAEIKTDANGNLQFINNTTISAMLYQLNNMQGIPPIIDSSGITGNIDLSLNIPYGNLKALKATFSRNGLTTTEEFRTIEMLVITEAPVL